MTTPARPSKTDQVPITPITRADPPQPAAHARFLAELEALTPEALRDAGWDWAKLPTAADRYQVGERIAGGGMGSLFLATDRVLGRRVAVKVLHPSLMTDPMAVLRFLQEARIHAQFHHPGIPPLHDVGRLPDGRPFLAMKFVRGRTLAEYRADHPPAVDWDRYRRLFDQMCRAVGYAHAKGVVHRDLTPSNVLVSERGRVQVVDWGLAKVLDAPPPPADDPQTTYDTTLTTVPNLANTDAAVALGTPSSMPPELAGGSGRAGVAIDIFGLGAVLCFILTGRPPFEGGKTTVVRDVKASDLSGAFARLGGCKGPKELVALAKECLAPDPANRPTLAAVIKGAGGSDDPDESPHRSWWGKLFGRK